MKAIILSAGQGRRLLPMTAHSPKCAVPVQGRALIDWQIDQLAKCGIDRVTVVTGFGADQVKHLLEGRDDPVAVATCYNPFYEVADNLISCWIVRDEMTEDFVLLNGDTLFERAVLQRLLDAPMRPVTLARDHKPHYDDDDMKVHLKGDQLLKVGKDLPAEEIDGESIGLMVFRGDGPHLFRRALEEAVRRPEALKQWYLAVIGQMARKGQAWTESIAGLDWTEVDYPLDLVRAAKLVDRWTATSEEAAVSGA